MGRFGAAHDVASAPFWSRLAFRYLQAILDPPDKTFETIEKRGHGVRLVSTVPVDLGKRSIWYPYSDRFLTPLNNHLALNLVCENAPSAGPLWTEGMANIAIGAVEFTGQDLDWSGYAKYRWVFAPSEQQAELLRERGVMNACYMDRDPKRLLDHFEAAIFMDTKGD